MIPGGVPDNPLGHYRLKLKPAALRHPRHERALGDRHGGDARLLRLLSGGHRAVVSRSLPIGHSPASFVYQPVKIGGARRRDLHRGSPPTFTETRFNYLEAAMRALADRGWKDRVDWRLLTEALEAKRGVPTANLGCHRLEDEADQHRADPETPRGSSPRDDRELDERRARRGPLRTVGSLRPSSAGRAEEPVTARARAGMRCHRSGRTRRQAASPRSSPAGMPWLGRMLGVATLPVAVPLAKRYRRQCRVRAKRGAGGGGGGETIASGGGGGIITVAGAAGFIIIVWGRSLAEIVASDSGSGFGT